MDYKKDVLQAYETKINAYLYAREKVLSEYPKYSNINDFSICKTPFIKTPIS